MTHVLAIDPGLRATGYAYFRKAHLVRAGIKQCALPERADIAAVIGRELALDFLNQPLDALIVEVPQVYQPRLLKGDPNDLVSVALVAGCALQLPARVRRAVSPHQWKGNVHKRIHHRRLLTSLTPLELGLLEAMDVPTSLQHNVLDAVGLGKWYLTTVPKGRR